MRRFWHHHKATLSTFQGFSQLHSVNNLWGVFPISRFLASPEAFAIFDGTVNKKLLQELKNDDSRQQQFWGPKFETVSVGQK